MFSKPTKLIAIFTLLFFYTNLSFGETKSLSWEIKNPAWTSTNEKAFQEFITNIGLAREKRICSSVESCLKNPIANPLYFQKNPPELKAYSDCADLPFVLRAYFSWMNNLPYAYPIEVDRASEADAGSDIRYTPNGNIISAHYIVKNGDNINRILRNVSDSVSSAMYRVGPEKDYVNSQKYPDFYSVKLSRQTILPGTVLYDPAGHILMVYKVENDGRILLIDAHPDGSLTKQVYGNKYTRSRPSAGAGFKAFRPIKLLGATIDSSGNYIGGKVSTEVNSNLSNYGVEQYYGTNKVAGQWNKGTFVLNDQTLNYYDYVRKVLSVGNLKYNPLTELKEMMKSLCDDLKDRKDAINKSIASGLSNQAHPSTLPSNIYGTSGEWESFSSPSRDARFKAATREIRKSVQTFIEMYNTNNSSVDYQGDNLPSDLYDIYSTEANGCEIQYKKTNGEMQTLNLDQVIDRIYDLSFDPYNCIELRWGASGSELSSCTDGATKRAWYDAEAPLRNLIDRNYDLKMNKTLNELPNSGLGLNDPEDINIRNYLNAQR